MTVYFISDRELVTASHYLRIIRTCMMLFMLWKTENFEENVDRWNIVHE